MTTQSTASDPFQGGHTIRAYRIEHYLGVGPFAAGLFHIHYHHALDAIQRGVEQPSDGEHISILSQADGLQYRAAAHHVFGCERLDDLRQWFPSRLGCEAMTRAGAVLRAFAFKEGDRIRATTRLMFDSRAASVLWTLPANRLHSLADDAALEM
ncbi:MAG: hypothetical protein ACOH2N_00325 [Devosia sp.]